MTHLTNLTTNLHHLAEHMADEHDGLPLHAKNTVLLAAKVIGGDATQATDPIREQFERDVLEYLGLRRYPGSLDRDTLNPKRYGDSHIQKEWISYQRQVSMMRLAVRLENNEQEQD